MSEQTYHPASITYRTYVPKSRRADGTSDEFKKRPPGVEPTGMKDLPMELLELIASYLPSSTTSEEELNPSTYPVFKSPVAYFEPSRNPLLAFSQTCRAFRLASLQYLPHLNRAIIFTSLGDLENLLKQEDKEKREIRRKLKKSVKHVTLDFLIPMHTGKDRLKSLLLAFCIHPSLRKVKLDVPSSSSDLKDISSTDDQEEPPSLYIPKHEEEDDTIVLFPHLAGITLTSRFLASYMGWQNVHRDWAQVASHQFGIEGWQAKVLGGIQTFGAFMSGGQMLGDNWCDIEVLFLEWNESKGERWTTEIENRLHNVFIPPLPLPSLPNHPIRLLLIPFPPSSPSRPSPLVPLPFQASHLLVSSLMTNRSLPFSPLRSLDTFTERTSQEAVDRWRIWESSEERVKLKRNPFWSWGQSVNAAVKVTQQLCFEVPQPEVIDKLLELDSK